MISPDYAQFIENAKRRLRQDPRIVGLLAGGSMMTGTMDEFSDLDLIVVYDAACREEVMSGRASIAAELGSLLSSFTGEHVGEPRLLICLYDSPLLHVDLKFVAPEELERRIEDPLVLWERGEEIRSILRRTQPSSPSPDSQWLEDRFWIWVHYGATKLGRGELFELIDLIGYIRATVLGPLILAKHGQPPRGVRKLEQSVPDAALELEATVPSYNAESCYNSLRAAIRIYRLLRSHDREWTRRQDAEEAAVAYLDRVYASISRD